MTICRKLHFTKTEGEPKLSTTDKLLNLLNPPQGPQDTALLSPLTLAFMGDAVYEILVREKLLTKNRPAAALHRMAVAHVCAAGQSGAYALLEGVLSEQELLVMRRGRNAHSGHRPKNATVADYRRATGVEALFGYLYLSGSTARLRELFELIWQAGAGE